MDWLSDENWTFKKETSKNGNLSLNRATSELSKAKEMEELSGRGDGEEPGRESRQQSDPPGGTAWPRIYRPLRLDTTKYGFPLFIIDLQGKTIEP